MVIQGIDQGSHRGTNPSGRAELGLNGLGLIGLGLARRGLVALGLAELGPGGLELVGRSLAHMRVSEGLMDFAFRRSIPIMFL